MMKMQSAMLLTDWMMWFLVLSVGLFFFFARKKVSFQVPWQQICRRKIAMISLVILLSYAIIGLSDCIHIRITYPSKETKVVSLLDLAFGPLASTQEKSYSKPLATHLYSQAILTQANGAETRVYPRLNYAGRYLKNPDQNKHRDILLRSVIGLSFGIITGALFITALMFVQARRHSISLRKQCRLIFSGKTLTAWREALITFALLWVLFFWIVALASHYHVLGTDKIGQDVLYLTTKSIRTGLIIGTLTTLFMLPFALLLGVMAGYFGRWIDDIIQYLYTTLSSIPGVLLISATILVLQVYINQHPELFPTIMQRADARLVALCAILGITSWAGLCRLLRAETLKLRELDFVTAAKSLGVRSMTLLRRHILPNVMHIIIITLVLDFSSLVLAEAVLSYVGVGVDPTTISWGNMINSSRLELAREPIVWWPLLASLIFMFFLVLSANLFADTVRDALDPRLREME